MAPAERSSGIGSRQPISPALRDRGLPNRSKRIGTTRLAASLRSVLESSSDPFHCASRGTARLAPHRQGQVLRGEPSLLAAVDTERLTAVSTGRPDRGPGLSNHRNRPRSRSPWITVVRFELHARHLGRYAAVGTVSTCCEVPQPAIEISNEEMAALHVLDDPDLHRSHRGRRGIQRRSASRLTSRWCARASSHGSPR